MKNRKGFTLIELLAVIVILAVIMVIAVPQILNVIESSKESVASSSIKLVKDAIRTQVSTSGMSGVTFEKGEDGCYKFDFNNQESGNASKLSLKNKDKIGGSIKYCNGKFSEDTLKFEGTSVSGGGNGGETAKVCKRADTLHTEICTQNDDTYYCSGAGYTASGSKGTTTITYGNDPATRESGKLTSGDAFDCDVTGTGNYERFYYVTDLESDPDKYAVLIYYNNVSGGEANSAAPYAYASKDDYIAAGGTESDYGSYGNWNKGPLTIVKQLPSTSKWSKVSLTNTSRNIKDQTGTERIGSFNYSGYAARLLTYQEMTRACGTTGITTNGYLDNCNYLMENTKYSSSSVGNWGYWLENPNASYSIYAWIVSGRYRNAGSFYVSSARDYGARPVIEVLKTNISY